jgi:hypothetical protein
MADPENLLSEIQELIINLRKGKEKEKNWTQFKELIENNLDEVCKAFDM